MAWCVAIYPVPCRPGGDSECHNSTAEPLTLLFRSAPWGYGGRAQGPADAKPPPLSLLPSVSLCPGDTVRFRVLPWNKVWGVEPYARGTVRLLLRSSSGRYHVSTTVMPHFTAWLWIRGWGREERKKGLPFGSLWPLVFVASAKGSGIFHSSGPASWSFTSVFGAKDLPNREVFLCLVLSLCAFCMLI